MNGRWETETGGSWTAVSKAPCLKALVLLGKGDCWHGGGLFTDNHRYWFNNGRGHRTMLSSDLVRRDETYQPIANYGGECLGVYYVQLQRHDWLMKPAISSANEFMVLEKPWSHGWVLRKYAHAQVGAPPGKGCYRVEHELEHTETGQRIDGVAWEWAELDDKRLVWAERECLFEAKIKGPGLEGCELPHDFNNMQFEALAAPH